MSDLNLEDRKELEKKYDPATVDAFLSMREKPQDILNMLENNKKFRDENKKYRQEKDQRVIDDDKKVDDDLKSKNAHKQRAENFERELVELRTDKRNRKIKDRLTDAAHGYGLSDPILAQHLRVDILDPDKDGNISDDNLKDGYAELKKRRPTWFVKPSGTDKHYPSTNRDDATETQIALADIFKIPRG